MKGNTKAPLRSNGEGEITAEAIKAEGANGQSRSASRRKGMRAQTQDEARSTATARL